MRLPLFALFFLVLSIPALADTPLIWTTNADSSNVSFIVSASLEWNGNVEILFGTNDGLLHCWQLGSCFTGYAPWPQFQHDPGRSGVLE